MGAMELRGSSGLFNILSQVVGSSVSATLLVAPSFAQITPDGTLGVESSVVTPSTIQGLPADLIEGGAARGANLFHSFSDFNVNAGQAVYFANPVGIENILSRVTGGSISNIDGLLGVDGAANLFLLNPNGVVFGPNASLDISGSFVTSTGSSFAFEDGSEFSAAPAGNPVLTVSVPIGVQFNDQAQGDITNQGDLAVGAGETLTLWGDTVLSSGGLIAEGGTVQVLGNRVALVDQATVDVSAASGGGTVLIGGDYQGQGLVPNADRTFVSSDVVVSADALQAGDGGRVIVWADEATNFAGAISAQGGTQAGNGGFVEVSGATSLDFAGTVNTQAVNGANGQLLLDPTNITIADTAPTAPPVFTTVGQGDAVFADFLYADTEDTGQNSHLTPATVIALLALNDLTLEATDTITVNGYIINPSANNLTLQANNIQFNISLYQIGGGNLTLVTPQTAGSSVVIERPAGVLDPRTGQPAIAVGSIVPSGATLDAGNVRITTQDLFVRNAGLILANTVGVGNSGRIQIDATGNITVDGAGSFISSSVDPGAIGNSGGIAINTGNLSLSSNGQIVANTFAQGNSGLVQIDATGDVIVDAAFILSRVQSGATVISGGIAITTNDLSVLNGGQISAGTFGRGDAGQVQIDARGDITVDGGVNGLDSFLGSGVAANAIGNSGDLVITTNNLNVLNRGRIDASTFANGNSGLLQIDARGAITVDAAFILSRVESTVITNNNSGGIAITTNNLSVSNGAEVSASTFGAGIAGDLLVQSPNNATNLNIDLSGGGQITAITTSASRSGNITLSTPGTLTVQGAGTVTVESSGANAGEAGNLNVDANAVILDNGVELSAQTASTLGGGNVNFQVPGAIALRRGSFINAESTNPTAGDGGNITINTGTLIAPLNENNDIIANAVGGNGGRVEVNALSILIFDDPAGLTTAELRARSTNDLSASSQTGVQGTVSQITPNLDPSQGVSELPADLTDRANQITPGCGIANTDDGSSFVITGSGGLPPSPSDPIAANGVNVPWLTYDDSVPTATAPFTPTEPVAPLIEATALIIGPDGIPYLVVDPEAANAQLSGLPATGLCAATRQG